jgi:hypothetical protein
VILDAERKNVFSWLSASMPVPNNNYDSALEKRLGGTASWIFKEDHFVQWKQSSGSFLHLIGKRKLRASDILMFINNNSAGSGKTVLWYVFGVFYKVEKNTHDCMNSSASIIKSVKQNDITTCAYFFFDRRDAQALLQSYDGLLRSIAYQLCVDLEEFPGILMRSYQNCGSGTTPPSRDALQQICTAALLNLQETFIIIDALDECTSTEISQVVGWLEQLISEGGRNLHVLVTGRDEAHITDPLSRISQQPPVHVDELTYADIRLFIDLTMNNYGQLAQWGKEIQANVRQTLINGAGGM